LPRPATGRKVASQLENFNGLLDRDSHAKHKRELEFRLAKTERDYAQFKRAMSLDFDYENLSSATFGGRNLVAEDLSYSVLTDADFGGATLRQAKINYSSACGAKFKSADLRGAQLKHSVFSHAHFTGADCRGANFFCSILSEADFSGADIRGAIFIDARLGGRFDAKTIYDAKTRFPDGFDPVARGLTLSQ
jgi:uncharacterized protein YjbI with pentapeptide repeats